MAELADRRIKASRKQLYDALHGRLTDHHRFMLRLYLRQYDSLADAIAEIDQQVDAAIAQMDAEVAAGRATFRTLDVGHPLPKLWMDAFSGNEPRGVDVGRCFLL